MIAKSGLTPLDYMLTTLRDADSTDENKRWAAQNAAPYVHPRLSSVQAHIEGSIDLRAWLRKAK
jgi:hypothetical protein